MKILFIEPGNFAIAGDEEVSLETYLGSCVGVTLFDPVVRAGGLLHILLPEGPREKMLAYPSRYAETGIVAMLEALRQYGAMPERMQAHMAGGASIITRKTISNLNIGERNIRKAKKILEELGIPLLSNSVGGSIGRGMKIVFPNGDVAVRTSRRINIDNLIDDYIDESYEIDQAFLEEAAEKLKPDSKVAVRALQLVSSDDADFRELEGLILKDQLLAGRVIGLVNSARFGLPRKVVKISHAISLLGIKTFKTIVMQACLEDLYSIKFYEYELDEQAFFHHAVACAELASFLSSETSIGDPEEVYLSALMHDIGKILIERHFSKVFFRVKRRVALDKMPFLKAEKKELGITHAELGRFIAEAWSLPAQIEEVIAYHHEPSKASAMKELASLVHIANFVCNMAGIGFGIDTMANLLDTNALDIIRLDERVVTDLIRYVPEIVYKHGTP